MVTISGQAHVGFALACVGDCCWSMASYKGTRQAKQDPDAGLHYDSATYDKICSTACAGSHHGGATRCALAGLTLGTDIGASVTPQKLGLKLREPTL